MADRYDPKLSVRPLSERRPAAPADDSDPLVELARIVSGRTTFDPAPAPKAKTVPAAANGALSAEPSLANDLESELMNDLQASFAAVVPPPKPAAPARPAAPPPAAPVAARPVPIPQPKAPPPPARPAPAAAAPAAPPPSAFIPPRVAAPAPRPASAPSPAIAKPAPPPSVRPAAPPPVAKAPPPAERPARPAPPPARAERPAVAQPPVRPVDRGDFGSLPLRPTTAAHSEPPPASAGRWEKQAESDEGVGVGDPSRFAPPRAKNWFRANRPGDADPPAPAPKARAERPAPPPEPEITEADHDMFEDAPPTLAEADEIYQDDLALDDIAHYGDDDADLPPLVDELPDMGHRRTSRGLVAVAALLIVALAGGAGYVMLRGVPGTGTAAPVIAADPAPTKITPPDDGSQQTADAQNKLVYDRVDPASKPADDTTKLVTPGNEKIADVNKPDPSADDGNPVSRVIMQGGPAYDGTSGDDGTAGVNAPAKVGDGGATAGAGAASAAATDGDNGIGPRKVRTVVVRPDGTIVSSEAAPAGGSGTPAVAGGAPDPNKPPSEVAGTLNVPQGGTSMDTVLDKGGNIPVNSDPLNNGGAPASADAGAAPAPAGTVPASDGDGAAPAAPAKAAPAQPAQVATADDGGTPAASGDDGDAAAGAPAATPEPPAKPATPPKPKTVVAKGEPIDLTPAKKPAAAPAANPADAAAMTAGLSVQVTSQKSEAAAMSAFRSMQSRYAEVLGRYQPNVQRADLGDRGTYYRVRVGPFAGDGASRVCAALKAAGGDCIIVK